MQVSCFVTYLESEPIFVFSGTSPGTLPPGSGVRYRSPYYGPHG